MTVDKWIDIKLKENEYSNLSVYSLFEDFKKQFKTSYISKNTYCRYVRDRRKELIDNFCITESYKDPLEQDYNNSVAENVRLAKQLQKQSDLNRIKQKSFREFARLENGYEEYIKEIYQSLDKVDLTNVEITKTFSVLDTDKARNIGCIQISDTHLDERILYTESLGNEYDWEIASKRLKLLADESKTYFKAKGIKKVLVAFCGDLINNNIIIDKILANASNKSKATVLAVYLFEQFFLDLMQDFELIIGCVTGNESRAVEEIGYTDTIVTHNYDFIIFNMLRYLFRENKERITFVESQEYKELVISLNGFNLLLTHGEKIKDEKDIQKMMGKYSAQKIYIDYVLCGHIHSAFLSDIFSRNSSMCGGNAYSNRGLNLTSRASQNIHIIDTENSSISSIKIDLQKITNKSKFKQVGYKIQDELIAYNTKSLDKLTEHKTIYKVSI